MREMKDSGIEWIGEIPADWKVSKVKYFTKCLDGKRKPIDASSRKSGIYPYWGAGSIVDYIDEYLFDEEVILLGEDGAPFFDYTRPVSFLVNEKVWVNNHIHVLKPDSKNVDSAFLVYWLNNVDYKTYINGSILCKLTQSNMNNIAVAIPSLAEQQKISTYLDTKCTKIDSIIEKQEKVIEKLKEYKLSVITEAVTKGLNPDVKMKDSGVEWIGEIPDECKVTRAGHIFNIILGKMLSPTPKQDDDTFEKYLCAANVHFTGISYEPLKQMWFSKTEKKLYAVHLGDLLVVEGGAGAGGAAIVEKKLGNCYIQNSIMIVRSKENTSNKWLYYTLYSIVKRNYVDFVCNKATIPHFTKDKLGNVPVVKFKKENETEIINYLDKKCSAIDKSIEQKQAIIEKLKEYKKSLIYEVVTGKREV